MEKSTAYLMLLFTTIGGSSMLYFLCLASHLPFFCCLILALVLTGIFIRQFKYLDLHEAGKIRLLPLLILLSGVVLITNRTWYLATVWGEWDAWSMWNLHARFLCEPQFWTHIFSGAAYDHPDYPLALPGSIAFFYRLCGGHGLLLITFAIHFLITLCVPVVVFLQVYKKNLALAALGLLFLATDDFYLERGLSQFADTLLGAFLVLAMITAELAQKNKRYILFSVFFAGCAAWTKNEGIIIAILLLAFYSTTFFRKEHIRLTLIGAILPVATLIIFKLFYAPANDLMQNGGEGLLSRLGDGSRYQAVLHFFKQSTLEHFLWPFVFFGLCLLGYCFQRKFPGKPMLLVLSIVVVYFFTYILTPNGLTWHLVTSQTRLMHQLVPALILVTISDLAGIRLPLFRKKLL